MTPQDVLAEPAIQALLAQEYPRFTDAEYDRRRARLAAVMAQHGCDHLLIAGEQRSGTGPGWITGWPTSTEAYVIFRPGEQERMYMEWYNHWMLARKIARQTDVQWGEHRGFDRTIEDLTRRGAKRIGLMGPIGFAKGQKLAAAFDVVDLGRAYARMRLVKSAEEITWLRLGAALSDLGQQALRAELRVGMTERELGNLVERAWTGLGGATFIHYMGITPMAAPTLCIPPQHPSPRPVRAGDVVFTEFTAHFWDYPGQVLRTYRVAADPTPLFQRLYDTAFAAFTAVCGALRPGATMQQLVDASGVIEDAGFTIYDDLLHGFGGGYFPPILGSRSRPAGPLPDIVLEENMTVVVQPNVVTPDQKAGVQLGELVRVTATGCESLHTVEHGFRRIGD